MRKSLKGAVLAAALIGLAGAASAAPTDGVYVGGTVGVTRINVDIEDKSATAVDVFVGKKYGKTFGVEAGVIPVGKFVEAGEDVKTSAAYLVGTADYAVAPQTSLFAQAGLAFTKVKDGDDGVNVVVGAGVKYDLTKNVQLRADVKAFNDFANTGEIATKVGFGAAYKF